MSGNARKQDEGLVTPLRSAPLPAAQVPSRVLIAPWGHVESTNGDFTLDAESVKLALAAFETHGTDLPIDYEHQTLGGTYAAPDGQAPAAGWIKSMSADEATGLWAEIEWTDQAIARLAAREYRYLSPVAIVRKADRKLVAVHSAALTNKPAIVGMQPIVNREASKSESSETLRTEPALSTEPASTTGAALPHGATTPTETAFQVDPASPVGAETEELLAAAQQKIATLEQEARDGHVSQRIAEATSAGKLVEAQRSWAETLVARDEPLFDEWLETAPTIVVPGATKPPRECVERSRSAAAARARAEYRTDPLLSGLTSEEAYVADALKAVGA